MKILVVGPSWVGDAVISQSLFKIIYSKSEDIEIDVLSPQWTVDIFEEWMKFLKLFFFHLIMENLDSKTEYS